MLCTFPLFTHHYQFIHIEREGERWAYYEFTRIFLKLINLQNICFTWKFMECKIAPPYIIPHWKALLIILISFHIYNFDSNNTSPHTQLLVSSVCHENLMKNRLGSDMMRERDGKIKFLLMRGIIWEIKSWFRLCVFIKKVHEEKGRRFKQGVEIF